LVRDYDQAIADRAVCILLPGTKFTPRCPISTPKAERLLEWFQNNAPELHSWIQQSELNARWFARDPVAAIFCAGLQLDDELVCELEMAAQAIGHRRAAPCRPN